MQRPQYSIVISFYNEERQAAAVIQRLIDVLNVRGVAFEFIVVNNGSTDGTEAILKSFAQRDLRVVHITVSPNIGFGGGTWTGLARAQGAFIGFTTAGGQVSPEHVLAVFETARDNPRAVVKAKRVSRESFWRSLMAWGYGLVVNALFFVGTQDIDGHPLVLAKETFDTLAIRSKNLMLNLEILSKAKRRGLQIIEVPVPYSKRLGGKSHTTLSTVGEFLRQLIAFRISSIFHR